MKSIRANFDKNKKRNPQYGDYICLMQAIRGKGYTRRTLYSNFMALINSEDYDKEEISTLVDQLHEASKPLEDCTTEGKFPLRASQIHLTTPASSEVAQAA